MLLRVSTVSTSTWPSPPWRSTSIEMLSVASVNSYLNIDGRGCGRRSFRQVCASPGREFSLCGGSVRGVGLCLKNLGANNGRYSNYTMKRPLIHVGIKHKTSQGATVKQKEGGYRHGSKSRPAIVQNVRSRKAQPASTSHRWQTPRGARYITKTRIFIEAKADQADDHTAFKAGDTSRGPQSRER